MKRIEKIMWPQLIVIDLNSILIYEAVNIKQTCWTATYTFGHVSSEWIFLTTNTYSKGLEQNMSSNFFYCYWTCLNTYITILRFHHGNNKYCQKGAFRPYTIELYAQYVNVFLLSLKTNGMDKLFPEFAFWASFSSGVKFTQGFIR